MKRWWKSVELEKRFRDSLELDTRMEINREIQRGYAALRYLVISYMLDGEGSDYLANREKLLKFLKGLKADLKALKAGATIEETPQLDMFKDKVA